MYKISPVKTAKTLGAAIAMAAVFIPAAGASAASARPAAGALSAARSDALRVLCHSRGAIPVTAIPARVDLATCPIQGRLLVLPVPHYRTGPGLYAPRRSGETIAAYALAASGSYTLRVTNSRGRLFIKTAVPHISMAPVARRTDAACSENGMAAEGSVWNTTLNWFYNMSTVSRAGLSGSATLSDIRAANFNMTMGINNCGLSETGFRAYGAYQGTTGRFANIDSAGHCTNNFPDGQNTVSWGPFSGVPWLAYTCVEQSGQTMTESDTYLGSNVGMVDNYPANCNGLHDLQSIMTHEWGHAYGLGDLLNNRYQDEVMFQGKPPCTLRRHLGLGDYNGMGLLYFPR